MSSYEIIILERVIDEITDTIDYYNKNLKGLGIEFKKEIFKIIELIQLNPYLFQVKFSRFREAVMRRFPYVIIYVIERQTVIIVSVFHVKRNPGRKNIKDHKI